MHRIGYVILDDNDEVISMWDSLAEAREELTDLNATLDVVDYIKQASPGEIEEELD